MKSAYDSEEPCEGKRVVHVQRKLRQIPLATNARKLKGEQTQHMHLVSEGLMYEGVLTSSCVGLCECTLMQSHIVLGP